jgi:lysophospholipase L1-like esterase
MPRERRSKYANDAKDTAQLASSLAQSSTEIGALQSNKADKTYVDTRIGNIGNASPRGTYATLAALQTAFPTGTTGIYLVTADGKWYYWKDTAWTAGGTYQSTGMANRTVTHLKTDFLDYKLETFVPVNIFDKNTLSVQGEYCNPATGEIQVTQYTTNYFHTDYLPVRPSVRYISKVDGLGVAFYDKDKVYISGAANGTSVTLNGINGFAFTSPSNAAFAIKNTNVANKDTDYFYMGEEDLSDPTQYKLDFPKLNLNAFFPLKGKKVVCFGDSVIEFGTIPEQIATLTGATVYDCSYGGTRMTTHPDVNYNKFCMTSLVDAVVAGDFSAQQTANINLSNRNPNIMSVLTSINWNEVDIVTISYGTNDFGGGVYIGTDTDPLTSKSLFNPAVRYVVETLLTKYPHIRIYFTTPIYRHYWGFTGVYNSDLNPRSGTNLYLKDFGNEIIKLATKYHLPSLDLYNKSGINSINKSYFLSPDDTHPTDKGYSLLAKKIAGFLATA